MVIRLSYEKKANLLKSLNDKEQRILESIRYDDSDLSTKASGILTFSGLISAITIVQLTASKDSIISVSDNFPCLITCIAFGLFFLIASAIINLVALTISGKYSGDKEDDLKKFSRFTDLKAKFVYCALWSATLGTLLTVLPLFSVFV